ncbi:MAG: bifunctional precorrin-2 dehydrogenase/sirohydrochlorin ferrochelatase [bacterium]
MSHSYMPISVALKGTPCLVVGGGRVALRKIDALLDYDAEITVVAPRVEEKIKFYAEKQRLKLEQREYVSPEAANYRLVISASDLEEVNRAVYDDTRRSGTLVNVVDNPPLCDFIFPAVVRRDCLTAAISTDGKAPFLAGHLRVVLENIFPEHWNRLAKLAGQFRTRVLKHWPDDQNKRNDSFAAFLNADWKAMFADLEEDEIEARLQQMIKNPPFPTIDEDDKEE